MPLYSWSGTPIWSDTRRWDWPRHQITPAERGCRPKVAPGQSSKMFGVVVDEVLHCALMLCGPAVAREGLRWTVCRKLGLPVNTGPEKMRATLEAQATLKIQPATH